MCASQFFILWSYLCDYSTSGFSMMNLLLFEVPFRFHLPSGDSRKGKRHSIFMINVRVCIILWLPICALVQYKLLHHLFHGRIESSLSHLAGEKRILPDPIYCPIQFFAGYWNAILQPDYWGEQDPPWISEVRLQHVEAVRNGVFYSSCPLWTQWLKLKKPASKC